MDTRWLPLAPPPTNPLLFPFTFIALKDELPMNLLFMAASTALRLCNSLLAMTRAVFINVSNCHGAVRFKVQHGKSKQREMFSQVAGHEVTVLGHASVPNAPAKLNVVIGVVERKRLTNTPVPGPRFCVEVSG
jgi:hypothetical protein